MSKLIIISLCFFSSFSVMSSHKEIFTLSKPEKLEPLLEGDNGLQELLDWDTTELNLDEVDMELDE